MFKATFCRIPIELVAVYQMSKKKSLVRLKKVILMSHANLVVAVISARKIKFMASVAQRQKTFSEKKIMRDAWRGLENRLYFHYFT